MNISDFLAAKKDMELEIQSAVLGATLKFWGATGYTPRSISISFVEKTTLSSSKRQYVVELVRSEVEL